MQGKISHSIGSDMAVEMCKGDTISVPQDILHNATNIGDTEAVLFIAFSSADRETKGE
jgi:quercetin dioxygenase-like cupin family protein